MAQGIPCAGTLAVQGETSSCYRNRAETNSLICEYLGEFIFSSNSIICVPLQGLLHERDRGVRIPEMSAVGWLISGGHRRLGGCCGLRDLLGGGGGEVASSLLEASDEVAHDRLADPRGFRWSRSKKMVRMSPRSATLSTTPRRDASVGLSLNQRGFLAGRRREVLPAEAIHAIGQDPR